MSGVALGEDGNCGFGAPGVERRDSPRVFAVELEFGLDQNPVGKIGGHLISDDAVGGRRVEHDIKCGQRQPGHGQSQEGEQNSHDGASIRNGDLL
ncbi:hypothetical protein SDC9_120347 [bioreactor metagenome]|uniref:Uncharacterized protein n=1 Tax=bioreactor metagenome TaxID=1076179 RepID=A0A645C7X1_9ZZZZ